ncbi:MAG: protease modulator HflC [Pseudomonadaceae bacterium]|nr:protease modulator HflC [Pseudomonadaceae bacterium]
MNRMTALIVAVVAVVFVLLNTLFTVRETQQVMVLALGRVDRLITEPGLYAKIPFYNQLVVFDKRILQTHADAEEVQTLDKKRIVVDSFTRWRIVDAAQFYRAVRNEGLAVQRIATIVNSNIRAYVASVPLHDLISGERAKVMRAILDSSRDEAKPLGIKIVDVRIKRADLPTENSEAVFRRMRAERQKEAAEIRASGEEEAQKIRADAEKQRTIILAEAQRDAQKLRGEGDADAIRIGGQAFNADPSLYKLIRSLDAYKAALQDNTVFVLDGDNAFTDSLIER